LKVFADTVYWFALLSPRDALHHRASEAARVYKAEQIVTSEMILTELLNSFSEAGQERRAAIVRAVESLRDRRRVAIYPQTSQLFESAFNLYRKRGDKGWSLTDCASFVIMQEHQLTAALTQDRHFVQAGFDVLLC
jgi:predicted nucleic acid-binding protein